MNLSIPALLSVGITNTDEAKMNLREAIQALEALSPPVTVALDIGVHEYCSLDSNCPVVIQFRRFITDAGITFEQLLEGYQESIAAADPISYELPEFDAVVHLNIVGKVVDVDLNDIISSQIKDEIARKLHNLERISAGVQVIGSSLYRTYLNEIQKHRCDQTLPQLSFDYRELLESGCLVTSREKNYYFLFPSEYAPRYIVDRGGTRYELSVDDIEQLRRKIYFLFIVTRENKFLRADVLDEGGAKLSHYHGDRHYDCWGNVTLPTRWDGTLESLVRLAHSLAMSLGTIISYSMLNSYPPGMPGADNLRDRSTRLGVEGELEAPAEEQPHPLAPPIERRGWGRRG